MKNMFLVLKKKWIVAILILMFIIIPILVGFFAVKNASSPKSQFTVVIDAGHGGRDDGCSGENGSKESVINLAIAKKLKSNLESLGINIVLTRLDGNGLYDSNATNFKQSDMEKRIEIINNAKPQVVISIHQNSFSDKSICGAQAFYQENYEMSMAFAECVQNQLISQLPNARKNSNKGDYYLLKESSYPSIIVECGYLTNSEEEKMLQGDEYQDKVAYAIMCGVVKYFNLCGND